MTDLRIDKTGPSLARHEQKAACHVFEISDDLLGSASVDGYFTSLNAAWERTLGFSREALMGQPFIEFVHPADRAATLAEVEKLAAGSDTVDFENRYARKDGGWCWLSWQAAVRAGDFYFSAHDVTAQVAAEQRRHLLTNLVAGIDDAILTKTTDGVVTSWNLAAEELYGFTADEAIGRSMLDLIVPKDRADEPEAIVRRLLEGHGVRQYTTQRQRKNGTMLAVSLTASLLRDDEHKVLGVAVISRDISEPSLEDSQVRDEIDTLVWVGRIRDAIDEDRIVFHAQPIVSLRGEPTSYELLCRLTGRDGELVSPARFLPVAENYGLIVELDLLAVSEAAAQIAQGHEVSINLSTATVGRRHIVDVIAERLIGAGADPSKLTLEITETALMKDIAAAQRFRGRSRAVGLSPRARRLRYRVRRLHVSEEAADRSAQDRRRIRPRPAQQQRKPACGQRPLCPWPRRSASIRSPKVLRTNKPSRCSTTWVCPTFRATTSRGRLRCPTFSRLTMSTDQRDAAFGRDL